MNDKEGKKHDTVNVTYPSIHQELGFHQLRGNLQVGIGEAVQ